MAQRVNILLFCDMHDEEAPGSETVTFAIDGTGYELDLCAEHAQTFRQSFAPYVGIARKSTSSRNAGGRPARRRQGGADRRQSAQIREWARQSGIEVSERGRIASSVVERYRAAH